MKKLIDDAQWNMNDPANVISTFQRERENALSMQQFTISTRLRAYRHSIAYRQTNIR